MPSRPNPYGIMYTKTKIALIVTTTLSCGILIGPAQAALDEKVKQESSISAASVQPSEVVQVSETPEIVADATPGTDISYEETEVQTMSIPEPEPVVEEAPAPVVQPAPVKPAVPVQAPAPVAPAPVAPAAPAPVAASGKASTIASAALGQVGVMQDCTKLVTNSLAAVGINFHGWPAEYFSLGTQVSAAEAQPGDLIYYTYGSAPGSLAHIAVYIGNGQAVHGGWNGNQTIVYSVNVGSGPVYIRVR